eukprot:596037-Rhodomonas_salina.1
MRYHSPAQYRTSRSKRIAPYGKPQYRTPRSTRIAPYGSQYQCACPKAVGRPGSTIVHPRSVQDIAYHSRSTDPRSVPDIA